MFDPVSYAMGAKTGGGNVEIVMTNATFTDTNTDGNIVITEEAS